MVRQILQSRGIAVSARFSAATEAFAAASDEALLAAATGCADETEFLATLRHERGPAPLTSPMQPDKRHSVPP